MINFFFITKYLTTLICLMFGGVLPNIEEKESVRRRIVFQCALGQNGEAAQNFKRVNNICF